MYVYIDIYIYIYTHTLFYSLSFCAFAEDPLPGAPGPPEPEVAPERLSARAETRGHGFDAVPGLGAKDYTPEITAKVKLHWIGKCH